MLSTTSPSLSFRCSVAVTVTLFSFSHFTCYTAAPPPPPVKCEPESSWNCPMSSLGSERRMQMPSCSKQQEHSDSSWEKIQAKLHCNICPFPTGQKKKPCLNTLNPPASDRGGKGSATTLRSMRVCCGGCERPHSSPTGDQTQVFGHWVRSHMPTVSWLTHV